MIVIILHSRKAFFADGYLLFFGAIMPRIVSRFSLHWGDTCSTITSLGALRFGEQSTKTEFIFCSSDVSRLRDM